MSLNSTRFWNWSFPGMRAIVSQSKVAHVVEMTHTTASTKMHGR